MTMRSKLAAILALVFLASCGDDGGTGGNGGNGGNGSSDDGQLSSSGGEEPDSMQTLAGTMTYGGRTYKTIQIGSQTWMAENLNYEYKVEGSTYGNWCYNDSAQYCERYGRLYTWAAAMDSATTGCGYGKTCTASSGKVQGVCPTGWHLPSKAEWNTLFTAVGGADSAGTMLKSTEGWEDGDNGTDAYGFSALPSGNRNSDGHFNYAGSRAYFWPSSEYVQDGAYNVYLDYYDADAYQNVGNKDCGFAVRCVKDAD